ncbi:TPA: hypothetical protein ACOEPM_001247 [Stenotrophomonas maltophilia]
MTAFSDDLRAALKTAHSISEYLLKDDPMRAAFSQVHGWQGEAFQGLANHERIEQIEAALDMNAEKDSDWKTGVGLVKSETGVISRVLEEVLGRWRRGNGGNGQADHLTRRARDLRRDSKRGLNLLKILLTSLIAIVGALIPGIASILEAVKEAVEHFTA